MGRDQGRRAGKGRRGDAAGGRRSAVSQASGLLSSAEGRLGQGDVEGARKAAGKALRVLEEGGEEVMGAALLPALGLLAEIEVERGEVGRARELFGRAVGLDPEGRVPEVSGGGAEKFLWLAQLSEVGGEESVGWFERGAEVLRNDLVRLGEGAEAEAEAEAKRRKLAGALCAIAEVYMTDLSWEDDAEQRCERLIAEAMIVAPKSAETLQTLANIRLSQGKLQEANTALRDSMDLWRDASADSDAVPDFPTRISLARLLMEAQLEEDALEVVERLIREDDQSIEAWYLGGWCMYLLGEKVSSNEGMNGHAHDGDASREKQTAALHSSREWLKQSLSLYELLDYEDDRLRDHAQELTDSLNEKLGVENMDGENEDDEAAWESADGGSESDHHDDDDDHEMEGT